MYYKNFNEILHEIKEKTGDRNMIFSIDDKLYSVPEMFDLYEQLKFGYSWINVNIYLKEKNAIIKLIFGPDSENPTSFNGFGIVNQ